MLFAQDPFFDKCHREKMCPARCNLHRRKGRQDEKSDSSSFAELGSLVRRNDEIHLSCLQALEVQGIKIRF
jgi:hypothetical protein